MPRPDRHNSTSTVRRLADRLLHAVPALGTWIEIACIVALAALLLWKGVLPGWRVLNTDFPNYYLVARLLREGYSLDRIYDWVWLQRIKDHWGLDQSLVGFAGLTPFSALPIVPLSVYSAIVAKRIWIVANVLFLGASAELLNRVTSLGRRRIWLLCLLPILPLRTSFLFGQMHILVLLLLVLAYFFQRKHRKIACGVCLSIAGALKVYPLLFAIYFLWKKQWRQMLAMLCSALALVSVGYLWFDRHVLVTYAARILPRSLQGEVLDPYSVRAASGAALFHRLFIFEPMLNPAPVFNAPWCYAILYPVFQLAVFVPLLAVLRVQPAEPDTEHLEWAAFVFALLLLSPVPSSYHFVVMIFSIVLLVDVLLKRKEYGVTVLGVALYYLISAAVLSAVSRDRGFSLVTLLGFARLWLGLLLWALFLLLLWPYRAAGSFRRDDRRRLVLLSVIFAVVWVAGIAGYHRHFAYLKEDASRRMPIPAHTYLATGLRRRSAGYVFTAMLPDGYSVLDETGRKVWQEGNRPSSQDRLQDQLSAAVAGNTLLVELSDATGSRLIEVPSAAPPFKDAADAPILIPDAESPAISADGRSIAFIRELKGKGALWITRLQGTAGTSWSKPAEVAGNPYNVRGATFARSGRILFAAEVNGRSSIFSVRPGSRPVMFSSPEEEVDSPAVSPDERLIAFRKLVNNRWQLVFGNLATRQEKMLTFGDCNAYSPSWIDPLTIAYATDCGRGLGLTALASVGIGQAHN